jgi:hypothetical protein
MSEYEGELSLDEWIEEVIRDRERYYLVGGPDEAVTGRALLYDRKVSGICYIDGNDEAMGALVKRLYQEGRPFWVPPTPDAPKER